ncbi:MAG: hypothetical protein HIU89_12585 [Proteobacteria bacterium]|nr:hypothetical protein [Pseudomonadota bacterium]
MARQTKAILSSLSTKGPSAETEERYKRTHALLLTSQHTPQDHANTRAHYDFLRSAWRWGEANAIKELTAKSERARKGRDLDGAKRLTQLAFDRACALDWQMSNEAWAPKGQAIKDVGGRIPKKSKRFGPKAPDALETAINFGTQKNHGKAWARHEVRLLLVAAFGLRPAELMHEKGVRLTVEKLKGKALLVAQIHGAKHDLARGHYLRLCGREVPTGWQGAALKLLAELAASAGEQFRLHTTAADVRSANRLLNALVPGLSLYSFRHAVGSDLKAGIEDGTTTPSEAAAFMGHRSTASLHAYGHKRSGRGKGYKARADDAFAIKIVPHKAFQPAKGVPTFPPRPSERPATRVTAQGWASFPTPKPSP